MLRFFRFNYLNIIAFIAMTLICCGLQTTFWFQLFGALPGPHLWLNLLLYVILYRKPIEGIFTVYFLALFIKPFTAFPIGYLWLTLLMVFSIVYYAKKRLFWPTLKYFVIASLGTFLVFQISFYSISNWFESNSASFSFFHFFFEMVFTAITSAPIYFLASGADRWTEKQIIPEGGVTEA